MLKILSPQDFTITIEHIKKSKNMTYMDAIQYYCEQNKIEPETIGKLVQGSLKQKVREEAESLNFLPDRYYLYKETESVGASIGIFTNLTTVKHLVIFSICFLYFNQLNNKYGSLFKLLFGIYTVGIVWLVLFNSYSILAARVATFFTIVEIILVPMIVIYFTNERFAKIIVIFYALIHLTYNLYMTQEVKYEGNIFSDSSDKCIIQRF